jgi:hypothetical protein
MAIATCGPPADGLHQPRFDRQEGRIMRLFISFFFFFSGFPFPFTELIQTTQSALNRLLSILQGEAKVHH